MYLLGLICMDKKILLRAENISKQFPGVQALDKVDFDLYEGEVHVLLGENGAGKSTLIKVFGGAYIPDEGELFINGEKVEIFTPRQAQKTGIGVIYQEFNLVPYLNVAQNIYLDHMPKKNKLFLDHKKMRLDAKEILSNLNMNVDISANAIDISTAQQQMVEVAKALTHESKILIMDEPTASLTDREIDQLFKTIRRFKKQGMGIIYISHRLQELYEIGDRVTVLRDGKNIGTRKIGKASIDELVRMMVGHDVKNLFKRDYFKKGEEVLRVEGLFSKNCNLQNINMTIHRGEIVGLAGLVGSGRTELARAIFQADPYEKGKVFFFGEGIKRGSPHAAVLNGVGFLPEDRKQQGLALVLSVAENTIMASLEKLFPRSFINTNKEKDIVSKYITDLRIMTPSHSRQAQYLSGGNQQKVVLGKWLCTESEIFIFDEPTRGIDVGAKAEIHAFMNNLIRNGAAILMISSDLPEVIGMSDRTYVMREGHIVAEMDHKEATQEKVIEYALAAEEAKNDQRK